MVSTRVLRGYTGLGQRDWVAIEFAGFVFIVLNWNLKLLHISEPNLQKYAQWHGCSVCFWPGL